MNWMAKAKATGQTKTQQGAATEAARLAAADTTSLANIKPRNTDTRPADPIHVLALAESISALGLIEPIVVDIQGQLLAGLHRLTALQLLNASGSERRSLWEEILNRAGRKPDQELAKRVIKLELGAAEPYQGAAPTRQVPIDASADPSQALAIEIAENEQRRDYTRQEVADLKDRLQNAGYTFKRGNRGAAPAGMPALVAVVGKSRSTIERLLRPKPSNTSNDVFDGFAVSIERTISKWSKATSLPSDAPVRQEIAELSLELTKKILSNK